MIEQIDLKKPQTCSSPFDELRSSVKGPILSSSSRATADLWGGLVLPSAFFAGAVGGPTPREISGGKKIMSTLAPPPSAASAHHPGVIEAKVVILGTQGEADQLIII